MDEELSNPLNPRLYASLRKTFQVRVSNEREPFRSRPRRDRIDPSKWSEEILDSGEEYRICCPYCGDKRFRLYINHMWGTVNEKGSKQWNQLIHCFNEDCSMERFEAEYLRPYLRNRPHVRPGDFRAEEPILRTTLPGECVPLTDLPKNHPAIMYLGERDFDPHELFDLWGVRYCVHCPESRFYHAHLVEDRIIVPIYWDGELVGWQTRAVGEDSGLKYYTMPGLKKGRILYNGDRAKRHATGVLVEGVTDAWRVGTRCAGMLGKSISYFQWTWLCTEFRGKRLLSIMDPDAWEDVKWAKKMKKYGEQFPGDYANVVLPGDADPAKWRRADLFDYISRTVKVNLDDQ